MLNHHHHNPATAVVLLRENPSSLVTFLDGHKTHYMRHKTSIAATSPYFPLILYSINFCTQVQMCKTAFAVQDTTARPDRCEENTDTAVRSNGWYQRDTCIALLAQIAEFLLC